MIKDEDKPINYKYNIVSKRLKIQVNLKSMF